MRMKKRDRAIQLRDLALEIIASDGRWEAHTDKAGRTWRSLTYRGQGWSIGYRSPFQPRPGASESMKYAAALLKIERRDNLPFGLDIWAPNKVLNIEWDESGNIVVVSYKPGMWEEALEQWEHKRAVG